MKTPINNEALKQFLLRGWMTHDAMWFMTVLNEFGIATANKFNRAAIRAMAPLEVRRVGEIIGTESVADFSQVQHFLTGAMDLLGGDFLRYAWDWQPPDTLRVRVDQCFAHQGLVRLGAISEYECGIFDRIYAWFDTLGVAYRCVPNVEHCTMHHQGNCEREITFLFRR